MKVLVAAALGAGLLFGATGLAAAQAPPGYSGPPILTPSQRALLSPEVSQSLEGAWLANDVLSAGLSPRWPAIPSPEAQDYVAKAQLELEQNPAELASYGLPDEGRLYPWQAYPIDQLTKDINFSERALDAVRPGTFAEYVASNYQVNHMVWQLAAYRAAWCLQRPTDCLH